VNSALIEKIHAIERKHIRGDDAAQQTGKVLTTGWEEVDRTLGGGLPLGGLHEWFGLAPASANASRDQKLWRPPACVVIHFALRALNTGEPGRWAVWIGRRCFPYPAALLHRVGADRAFLQRSLFIAPRKPADRLWAIDLALRSPAVSVVVADGSEFDMAATRRIQLVAKNHAVPAFLVRPPWEQAELSAAHLRWLVRNVAADDNKSASANPAWTIELLRCKGVHWGTPANVWRLEWNRAECTLDLSTPVADPAGTAQTATTNTKHDERLHRLLA
jgi:hypothetical protein